MTRPAPELIHNQLGYRTAHGRKQILARPHPDLRGIFNEPVFSIVELNEFSKHPLNSPNQHNYVWSSTLRRRETDFGPWMVGDFHEVRTPGIYQAWCGGAKGPAFALGDTVYRRILPELIRYFEIQSCGRDVAGWHPACHLDDGFCDATGQWIEAAGGWHDAGDFRKWVSSTSLMAVGLLMAHRTWQGRETELGLPEGVFLREALQGARYFLSMQDPATGRLYNNVGGGRTSFHDNEENRYTDNLPRSGDERRIEARPPSHPPKFTTLYALYANALKATDPGLATRCFQAALRSADFDRSRAEPTADELQWRAWGFLELWRFGEDPAFQKAALAALSDLLALQVTEHPGGQNLTRGFFRAGPGPAAGYHRKHVGADYPVWVIGEFLEAFPGHPDRPRWREAVRLWAEEYAEVFAERNPFAVLPYAFYETPPPDHPHCTYRQLGDRLWFRYFMADNPFGRNARAALAAVALAAACRILGKPALLDLGYQQLDWILGANPRMLSTVTGIGVRQPSALSFQMGNIPGGVTMGLGGDAADMPCYFHDANPWSCCDEYYGYQAGHFIWAVTALESLNWT